jgi:HlyD family secretion protein
LNRKYQIGLVVVIIVVAGLFLKSVLKPDQGPKVEPKQHTVGRHDITKSVYGSGNLVCSARADVRSELAGKVIEIKANEGDKVEDGSVLAIIDNENIENEVSIARGKVAEQQDELDKLKKKPDPSEKLAAEVKYEEAKERHEKLGRDLSDKERLYEQGLGGTPREIADLKNSVVSAEKSMIIAGENLKEVSKPPTEVQIAAAESRLGQAELKLKNLQRQLDAQEVKSPISGTVLKRYIGLETLKYQPDQIYPEGSDLFIVGDLETVMVKGGIFESDVHKVEQGQRVKIMLSSGSERSVPGVVERVSLTPETKGNSVKFDVDISFSKPPGNINEGVRVGFTIIIDEAADVVAVPVEFLFTEGKEHYVLVEHGDEIARKSVEIGLSDDNYFEITSGLEPGDNIVWTLE